MELNTPFFLDRNFGILSFHITCHHFWVGCALSSVSGPCERRTIGPTYDEDALRDSSAP